MDQQLVNDHKALKFREIAERRVNTIVKTLRLIGNLSRKHSYQYTDLEVDKMFGALRDAVDTTEAKFKDNPPPVQPGFRFE
jgi:hypothetical protein